MIGLASTHIKQEYNTDLSCLENIIRDFGINIKEVYVKRIRWTRVWSRSFDHLIGESDHDEPTIPILTQKEAGLSLIIRTSWILLHISTCLVVIINTIHKW